MKKKLYIIIITCFLLITAMFILLCDLNNYNYGVKTTNHTNSGIVLSITTFDGKNESKLFTKSMGHSWISIDNNLNKAITFNGYSINPNDILTLSVYAIEKHYTVIYNLEPLFINDSNRYNGRISLSVNISKDDLQKIEEFTSINKGWELFKNCSYFSIHLWNSVVGEEYKLKSQTLIYTPTRLKKSIKEYDNFITNKDFSKSLLPFIIVNGERKVVEICE